MSGRIKGNFRTGLPKIFHGWVTSWGRSFSGLKGRKQLGRSVQTSSAQTKFQNLTWWSKTSSRVQTMIISVRWLPMPLAFSRRSLSGSCLGFVTSIVPLSTGWMIYRVRKPDSLLLFLKSSKSAIQPMQFTLILSPGRMTSGDSWNVHHQHLGVCHPMRQHLSWWFSGKTFARILRNVPILWLNKVWLGWATLSSISCITSNLWCIATNWERNSMKT